MQDEPQQASKNLRKFLQQPVHALITAIAPLQHQVIKKSTRTRMAKADAFYKQAYVVPDRWPTRRQKARKRRLWIRTRRSS